jgi:hypothetical protein
MSSAGIASNGYRFKYQCHRPKQTLVYQLIERHYDEFQSLFNRFNLSIVIDIKYPAPFLGFIKNLGFVALRCTASSRRSDGYADRNRLIYTFDSVPFDHDNLENSIEVLSELRSYSDLAELYDERYHWKQNLAELDDLRVANRKIRWTRTVGCVCRLESVAFQK